MFTYKKINSAGSSLPVPGMCTYLCSCANLPRFVSNFFTCLFTPEIKTRVNA